MGDLHIDIIYYGVPINKIETHVLNTENKAVKWFSREELDKIDVFPDIKITMDYILKHYYGG